MGRLHAVLLFSPLVLARPYSVASPGDTAVDGAQCKPLSREDSCTADLGYAEVDEWETHGQKMLLQRRVSRTPSASERPVHAAASVVEAAVTSSSHAEPCSSLKNKLPKSSQEDPKHLRDAVERPVDRESVQTHVRALSRNGASSKNVTAPNLSSEDVTPDAHESWAQRNGTLQSLPKNLSTLAASTSGGPLLLLSSVSAVVRRVAQAVAERGGASSLSLSSDADTDLILIAIVMTLVVLLFCMCWCFFSPGEFLFPRSMKDLLKRTPDHEDAGCMIPGKWMVLYEEGFGKVCYGSFASQREARHFFNKCYGFVSRIMFDPDHVEVESRGVNPYVLDGLRCVSKKNEGRMIPGKWMVLCNTGSIGATVLFFAFERASDARIFYNSFQVHPVGIYRPSPDGTHSSVQMRDGNCLDCRTTSGIRRVVEGK